LVDAISRLEFVEGRPCPLCEDRRSKEVWRGKYSDPDIEKYVKNFGYPEYTKITLDGASFQLCRCDDCDMIYHKTIMNDSSLARFYTEWADPKQAAKFEATYLPRDAGDEAHRRLRLALRLWHLSRQAFGRERLRLLDFGCGEGGMLKSAQLIGFDAAGVELSLTRAEVAKRSGSIVVGSLSELREQFGPDAFHVTVLDQVLEHIPRPVPLLRELAGLMPSGGILYAAVPDCRGITSPRNFDEFHRVHPLEHLNAFTPKTLARMAEKAGFRPIRRPPAFLGTSLAHALRAAAAVVWQPPSTNAFFAKS